MRLTFDKNTFGCMMLLAAAHGFSPTRPQWHLWERAAIEYERVPADQVGWWFQTYAVGVVTADEANQMALALADALAGKPIEDGATGTALPGFGGCIARLCDDKFRRETEEFMNMCRLGPFRIDGSRDNRYADLVSVGPP